MFDLDLELYSGLKVGGSEINFIIEKLLESKKSCGFEIETFKIGISKPQEILVIIKFDVKTRDLPGVALVLNHFALFHIKCNA